MNPVCAEFALFTTFYTRYIRPENGLLSFPLIEYVPSSVVVRKKEKGGKKGFQGISFSKNIFVPPGMSLV